MILVTTNDFSVFEFEKANEIVTVGLFLHVRNDNDLVAIFNDWLFAEIMEDEN